jgi:hypothetical protein
MPDIYGISLMQPKLLWYIFEDHRTFVQWFNDRVSRVHDFIGISCVGVKSYALIWWPYFLGFDASKLYQITFSSNFFVNGVMIQMNFGMHYLELKMTSVQLHLSRSSY